MKLIVLSAKISTVNCKLHTSAKNCYFLYLKEQSITPPPPPQLPPKIKYKSE